MRNKCLCTVLSLWLLLFYYAHRAILWISTRGSDLTSTTAAINGLLTNQMRLIYPINQLDASAWKVMS
jgi:hypothetical protein